MAIRPITFDGQLVTAKDDGAVYGSFFGDGILNAGAEVTLTNNKIHIPVCRVIVGGRIISIEEAIDLDISTTTFSAGYGRAILSVDLSESIPASFSTEMVEDESEFATLVKGDINDPLGSAALYQMEVARAQFDGNISIASTLVVSLGPISIAAAMPKSGGTFTGKVVGADPLTADASLRNIVVYTREDPDLSVPGDDPTPVETKFIKMIRSNSTS